MKDKLSPVSVPGNGQLPIRNQVQMQSQPIQCGIRSGHAGDMKGSGKQSARGFRLHCMLNLNRPKGDDGHQAKSGYIPSETEDRAQGNQL